MVKVSIPYLLVGMTFILNITFWGNQTVDKLGMHPNVILKPTFKQISEIFIVKYHIGIKYTIRGRFTPYTLFIFVIESYHANPIN